MKIWQQRTRVATRAHIFFLKLTSMIVFVSKTNFEGIGEELVEIHLSTKNKEKKFKKNAKCRKFSLRFSLEFSKKMSFFAVSRKTGFSKKWLKIMIRRSPTEISGDLMCFDRKFLKNDFGVRRAPISDFGLFFDFRSQKFRPLGKNGVFREAP